MIDPKLLRNDLAAVSQALAKRGVTLDTDFWEGTEARRKTLQQATEELQAKRNAGAKQVGQIKRAGGDASEVMAQMNALSDELKAREAELRELMDEIQDAALRLRPVN